ncbi:hypothetical protein AA103196_0448 [Ameyamaea chiangmaiensis NBRC 103196]|nr:hypothetical protein AA103196_0448 [Ameyamaea chiangmaiensis NBRC 103196]
MAAVLVLTACGGPAARPADPSLDQTMQVGRDAADQSDAAEAERQYAAAFTLALAHDNGSGLRDAGYNLAVVQLAQGHGADALATLARTRDGLAARNVAVDPGLELVEGAALHEQGRGAEALPHLSFALASSDPALSLRAALIMARLGDEQARPDLIDTAHARATALTGPKQHPGAAAQADSLEIGALWTLDVARRPADAVQQALAVADMRRSLHRYDALARALALAARAEDGVDPARARTLWRRAADAAQAQGDKDRARDWFGRAGLPMPDAAQTP